MILYFCVSDKNRVLYIRRRLNSTLDYREIPVLEGVILYK